MTALSSGLAVLTMSRINDKQTTYKQVSNKHNTHGMYSSPSIVLPVLSFSTSNYLLVFLQALLIYGNKPIKLTSGEAIIAIQYHCSAQLISKSLTEFD